jgi:ABC-2 type transport system permease protein
VKPAAIGAVARLELEQILFRPLSVGLALFFVILVGTAGYVGTLARDASAAVAPDFASTIVIAFMAFAIALLGPIVPILNTIHTVSEERSTRTMDLLLSRPVTRRELALGKILGRGAHAVAMAVVGILVGAVLASASVPLPATGFVVFALLVAMLTMAWVGLAALASTLLRGSTGVLGVALGLYFFFIIYGLVLGILGFGWFAALTNPNTLFLGAVVQVLTLPAATQQGLAVATTGLPANVAVGLLGLFIVVAVALATEACARQDEA